MTTKAKEDGALRKTHGNGMNQTNLLMWGIDHHRAPADVREKVHMDPDRIRQIQQAIANEKRGISSMILCTCNRTEIYLELPPGCRARCVLRRVLGEAGVDGDLFFGRYALQLSGLDVVRHLFRLTSGLESLMLGEYQIVAQIKTAYNLARENQPKLGEVLMRAVQDALRTGKRVRSETELGAGSISVAYAAVEEARRLLGSLSDRHGLLVGAGKSGLLVARHLARLGIGNLTILNRSPERAQEIAGKVCSDSAIKIRVRPLGDLESALGEADVAFTATGSTEPIIDKAMLERSLHGREDKPLYLVDIAVPRDVDPDVGSLESVHLTGIDELTEVVQDQMTVRQLEVPAAEGIVEEEVQAFEQWLRTLQMKPAVLEFRCYLEKLAEKQMGYVRSKQPDHVADRIEESLHGFIRKLLQQPVKKLKNAASEPERNRDMEALQRLFKLPQ